MISEIDKSPAARLYIRYIQLYLVAGYEIESPAVVQIGLAVEVAFAFSNFIPARCECSYFRITSVEIFGQVIGHAIIKTYLSLPALKVRLIMQASSSALLLSLQELLFITPLPEKFPLRSDVCPHQAKISALM
jgi:hypothetical protein